MGVPFCTQIRALGAGHARLCSSRSFPLSPGNSLRAGRCRLGARRSALNAQPRNLTPNRIVALGWGSGEEVGREELGAWRSWAGALGPRRKS